jgi:hypothetical protein
VPLHHNTRRHIPDTVIFRFIAFRESGVTVSAVFRQVHMFILFLFAFVVGSLFDHNILFIILTFHYLSIYHLHSLPFPQYKLTLIV